MFNFDLEKAAIFQAVKWEGNPLFLSAKKIKKLFFVLFIFSFLLFLYGFLAENFSQGVNARLFGFSLLFLALAAIFWLNELFFNLKLKRAGNGDVGLLEEAVSNPERHNLAEFLNFDAAKSIWQAIKFSKKRKLSQIPSESLLYFCLKDGQEINFIFYRLLLNVKEIKKELKDYLMSLERGGFQYIFSADSQKVLLEAAKSAANRGKKVLDAADIIISQAKVDPTLRKRLISQDIKIADIENLDYWFDCLLAGLQKKKRFWEWKNLIKRGTLAKEWTAGYTPILDKFSIDLTETLNKQGFPEMVGHQKEITAVERILARREQNNVLLVGEPGSGRKSILYGLAEKSILGESLAEVNFKRFVQLDLSAVLAQTNNQEEVERTLDKIFSEVINAGNVVLIIDEFHNFIGKASQPGIVDISGVISPYLPLPSFQIAAIATFEGLHKNIEQNSSILSQFDKVDVSGVSPEETLIILENLALGLEVKYKKFVSYLALRDIIIFCDRYLPAIPFPEKAMDALDEVMVYVSQIKEKIVLPRHAAKIIAEKTQIPVGEIEIKERQLLLNLETLLHQRIINQGEAVNEISDAMRRSRAEISIRKGTIGSFLFLGPTGVGKTETAKALAEIYFGSEKRMIRLDMSEFQSISDIQRLIGSPGDEGMLTTPVRETPFSLILLDEIEKAHSNILNLFLQVLDEGNLTDGLGRKVDFRNAIIISTSNAGYQIILEALKEKTQWSEVKEKLLNYVFEKGIFRPEFINRFDAVVVFGPLNKDNLLNVAELMLGKLKKKLTEKEIELIISRELKEKIVELGYDPTFGARNMQRVIQDKVGNVLAKAILSGELKRGSRAEVEPEEFKLIINP